MDEHEDEYMYEDEYEHDCDDWITPKTKTTPPWYADQYLSLSMNDNEDANYSGLYLIFEW